MLPRLVIQRTMGSLAVESKRAQLLPAQVRTKMSVKTEPARFEGSTDLPQVKIDQTESFASAGLKPSLRMSGDYYKDALNKGIETIGRIAADSSAFLRIENRRNTVRDLARQSMQVDTRLSVTSMPSVPPEIEFTGSDFQLNWSPSTMSIEWESVESQAHKYIPGEINISWFQRPSIEIMVEPGAELHIPYYSGVGKLVDEAT